MRFFWLQTHNLQSKEPHNQNQPTAYMYLYTDPWAVFVYVFVFVLPLPCTCICICIWNTDAYKNKNYNNDWYDILCIIQSLVSFISLILKPILLIFILNTIKKTPSIPALPKGASFFTHNSQHSLQPLSYCNIPLLSQAPNHNQCKSDLQSIVMSCHYYYSPY